jgi:hypothetical protein
MHEILLLLSLNHRLRPPVSLDSTCKGTAHVRAQPATAYCHSARRKASCEVPRHCDITWVWSHGVRPRPQFDNTAALSGVILASFDSYQGAVPSRGKHNPKGTWGLLAAPFHRVAEPFHKPALSCAFVQGYSALPGFADLFVWHQRRPRPVRRRRRQVLCSKTALVVLFCPLNSEAFPISALSIAQQRQRRYPLPRTGVGGVRGLMLFPIRACCMH